MVSCSWVRATEIPVFLWAFGYGVQVIILAQLYQDKVCLVGSNFNDGQTFSQEICDTLDDDVNEDAQNYVQTTLRYGRKPALLFSFFGFIVSDTLALINAIWFYELKADWLLLEIIASVFGGTATAYMAIYSYISDITEERNRTLRLAINDAVLWTGMALSAGMSVVIFKATSFSVVIGIGLIAHVAAFTWVFFILAESNPDKSKNETRPNAPGLRNFKSSLKVVTQERPFGIRRAVIACIAIYGIFFLCTRSHTLDNRFLRRNFNWETTDEFNSWYGMYSSVTLALNIVSLCAVLPLLSRVLKVDDLLIVFVSCCTQLASVIVLLSATVPDLLYLYGVGNTISLFITICTRAALTKIVGKKDVGKAFAVIGSVAAVANFIAPLYNVVYNLSLDGYLGTAYCIVAGLVAVNICTSGYAYFHMRWAREKLEIVGDANHLSEDVEVMGNKTKN